MKNILFDIISTQGYISGGGEYVKRVYTELALTADTQIYCLFDSKLDFVDDSKSFFDSNEVCKELLDIRAMTISEYVSKYQINVFFIGIAQRYIKYNLNNIICRTIVVIHDIGDIEVYSNNLDFHYKKNILNWLKLNVDYLSIIKQFVTSNRIVSSYKNIVEFVLRSNVELITVSNYSSNSIKYYFPELIDKKIITLYPPERLFLESEVSVNQNVNDLLVQKKKYFLLVNANRSNKNALLVYKTFQRYVKMNNNIHLVVVGGECDMINVINFDFLSISDLTLLYKNAEALIYPSITEGFGYPPLEAMKYGTPVISSNTCSMPEVLMDNVLYFSPFFQNDLFGKMAYLSQFRDYYVKRAHTQYLRVASKQSEDLKSLIKIIVG